MTFCSFELCGDRNVVRDNRHKTAERLGSALHWQLVIFIKYTAFESWCENQVNNVNYWILPVSNAVVASDVTRRAIYGIY
jgi:hypothetical protein